MISCLKYLPLMIWSLTTIEKKWKKKLKQFGSLHVSVKKPYIRGGVSLKVDNAMSMDGALGEARRAAADQKSGTAVGTTDH